VSKHGVSDIPITFVFLIHPLPCKSELNKCCLSNIMHPYPSLMSNTLSGIHERLNKIDMTQND